MNLIKFLFMFALSLLLLVTLWPLFVLLMMGLVLYWIYIRFKFNQMVERAHHEASSQTPPSAIDADYTERKDV